MSMAELGKHYLPKGSIVSPVRQRIVIHLKQHGECSTVAIVEMLLQAKLVTADELAEKPHWVQNQLAKLQLAGHIVRRYTDAQLLVWAAAPEPSAPAATVAAPALGLYAVAALRQIDKLHTEPYTPPSMVPNRPGALDFTRAPSLRGSQRVNHWSVE